MTKTALIGCLVAAVSLLLVLTCPSRQAETLQQRPAITQMNSITIRGGESLRIVTINDDGNQVTITVKLSED